MLTRIEERVSPIQSGLTLDTEFYYMLLCNKEYRMVICILKQVTKARFALWYFEHCSSRNLKDMNREELESFRNISCMEESLGQGVEMDSYNSSTAAASTINHIISYT